MLHSHKSGHFFCQKFAMQQTFKTMMSQMGSQSQFSNAGYAPGSPFPYTPPSTSGSNPFGYPYQPPSTSGMSTSSMSTTTSASSQATYPSSAASKTSAVVDVSPTKTEASEPEVVKEETENKTETKRSGIIAFPFEVLDFLVYKIIRTGKLNT